MFQIQAHDDIAAIATPPGTGGIAIIRISGINLKEKIKSLFKPQKQFLTQSPNTILYYQILDQAQVRDTVLVSYFRPPHSYTGEEIIEINTHGGMYLTRKVFELVLSCGIRSAQNGEFTKRAFLNGKLDLTQAEAIQSLIHAKSDSEIQSGILQLTGHWLKRITALKKEIIHDVQIFNLDIDFTEHIQIVPDYPAIRRRILLVEKEIKTLIHGKIKFDQINRVPEIILIGQPNVGKSRLINQLTGKDEIIVHHTEGTTRDIIEKNLVFRHHSLKLIDTAGLHQTDNEIEQLGIRKTHQRIKKANLILYVLDATRPELFNTDRLIVKKLGIKPIYVLNKIDQNQPQTPGDFDPILSVSAATGKNISALKQKLFVSMIPPPPADSDMIYIESRQLSLLREILTDLKELKKSLQTENFPEIHSFLLRQILDRLDRFTGATRDIEIINEIFEHFCIGK